MKKIAMAFFVVFMLANFAVAKDRKRQHDFAVLMIERSQLQQKLSQETSPEAAAAIRAQLKKIENKIYDMGISIPSSPEPPLGEVDRTDLAVPRRPSLAGEGTPVDFFLSVSPYFNDNYFQAVAGTPKESTWITNIASSFEVAVVRTGDKQFSIAADAEHNIVREIKNADWSSFGTRFIYATRKHRFVLRGSYSPERLTFLTANDLPGMARITTVGADYAARLTKRMRTRLFYRHNDARYPGFEDRNIKANFVSGDAQYQFHSFLIPGIGLEWTDARGKLDHFDYREISPILLLSARFGRVATLNLRYRRRVRDYPIDDIQASNFGRVDKRHDVYAYASIALGHYLDLVAFGSYLQNASSRANRSFTSLSSGATLQYHLPAR